MDNQNLTQVIWDQLREDRKKERRATYFKYGVIAALGAAYIGAGVLAVNKNGPAGSDYSALVRISGEIGPGKDASAQVVNPLLEKAFSDPNAKGVVLLINSPGGTPVQSDLIRERIVQLKQKHNKKVVAVGEDLMTSGAYMIATAADHIVVNRSTITGSIGVISRGFGFTGLMDKLGIERRVMTAGESKNLLDPFGPQTEQDKEKQAALLQQIHMHFKEVVAEGRGSRLKLDTPGLFSGTVWTGDASLATGLTDKLGDVKSANKEFLGADKFYEYSPTKPLLQSLMTTLGVSVAQELQPKAQGPMALPE